MIFCDISQSKVTGQCRTVTGGKLHGSNLCGCLKECECFPCGGRVKHGVRMYVCIYIYVCMYVHVRTYVRTYTCIYACMYLCMYICMYVWMYVCIYLYMCVCIYVCMNVCIYLYMYVCMYVCMCTRAPTIFHWGSWPSGYTEFMFHYKTYVIKTMLLLQL